MNHEDLKGRKPPKAPNTLTAREAADLIESIRRALTLSVSEAGVVAAIRKVLREQGIEPLRPCNGEAHSNPHVDYCSRCMPRWEWVGAPVCVGRSKPSGFR